MEGMDIKLFSVAVPDGDMETHRFIL